MKATIKIKRVYEKARKSDGYRVLVDKLWPRGISKEKAQLDDSFKTIAPSDALRKWFDHDPEKWVEFQRLYKKELRANKAEVKLCFDRIKEQKTVTLVYGAKDVKHNHALVLQRYFKKII